VEILKFNTRERLLASSMICGVAVLGFAGQAAAQQAEGEVSEIVVTGSRIPQPNLTSTSPLSVVNSQEVKLQGATSIETVLQNLPSVVPEFNQGVDNGATGTATVALRGLGSNRTLVLVNGNRLMPGDPIVPSPDLNNIPAALVERVEVVTGGASAVYGSDAVAGVVNFILTKDFEGVRLDATYSGAIHKNNNDRLRGLVSNYNSTANTASQIPLADNDFDAQQYDATIVVGVNAPDGKGNITAYASYRKIKPLDQGRRDYGACGISTVPSTGSVYDTQVCQGSGNSAFGRFIDFGRADNPNGTNTFVPYTGALAFNFGPFNYYQQDDERYTAGYFAHYEIDEHFDVYSDFMFADDHQLTQAAPSGLFFNNGPVHAINCANPLMSAQQAAIICGPGATVVNGVSTGLSIAYRLAGVPRLTQLDHTAYTIGVGTRGTIVEGWNYDLRAQYGKTVFNNVFTGDVSIRKINDALNAVAGPGGTPVCASGNTGCVPLNIFRAQSAGITQAQLDYIFDPGFKNGNTIEQLVT
jgi:outer membrane receptor protein involved in Fe transport